MVKNKSTYVHSIVSEFKRIHEGTSKQVDIDLTKIKPEEAMKFIEHNIHDKKLGIELPNDEIYMLNDTTVDKIKKDLIYNMAGGYEENQTSVNDGELVRITGLHDKITLKTTEPD